MNRTLTTCCYVEIKTMIDSDGKYESFCPRCKKLDPEVELVEFCEHCHRPDEYCICP